jgi:hypothetical protein
MSESRVFVIQEIAGTKAGNPKINIMGASNYSSSGKFNFLLPEFSLKWDKQERKYYPIEINLYEKGEIDE